MEITYLGHSSFRLKGKTATVVTDPYASDMTGLKFPKHIAATLVTVSHDHPDHNAVAQIEGDPRVVAGPGEYEIAGVGVVGISTYHDETKGQDRGRNTIYRIEIDNVAIAHLGDLGHTLSSADVDALGSVDVLLIPVGGVLTIDAKAAASIISEVDPSIVIPMHYGRAELNPKIFAQLAPLETFLKEIGKPATPQPKLVVSRDKLPDEMQVVVLE